MPTSFVAELKRQLPEKEWANVLRSLRHDKLVWESLQDEGFASKALKFAGSNPSLWSPGCLALLALDYIELIPLLKSTPPEPIDDKARHKAAAAFETITTGGENSQNIFTLSNAGMLAIALRERWRLLGQWDEIISELTPGHNSYWFPVVACLFSLLPNPDEFICSLLSQNGSIAHQTLGIHAIISNPFPVEDQRNILLKSILNLPSQRKLELLKGINKDHPTLGQLIAKKLVEINEESPKTPSSKIEEVKYLLEKSEILQISGEYEKAMPVLDEAWKTSTQLHTDLTAKLAQAAARDNDRETALQAIEQVSKIGYRIIDITPDLTLAKIHTGQLDHQLLNEFNEKENPVEPISPPALLATAKLAIQNNDLQKAQLIAQQALEVSLHLKHSKESTAGNQYNTIAISPEFLQSLSEALLDLGLQIEACRAAELSLEIQPNDPYTLWLLSRSFLALSDQNRALELAHIASALAPQNHKYRRNLVDVYIACKSWNEAKGEIENLITKIPNPSGSDFHTLAKCSLMIDQPKQAANACQRALHLDPHDGNAHALLGEAYYSLGDLNSAHNHFNQAIVSSPELPQPWIAIAKYHRDRGENEKAKERLLAAVQVVSEHPEIHFTLGGAYLKENSPTKALVEFQKAAQFAGKSFNSELEQQIAIQLGQTLFDLGYTDEACKTFEQAHQAFPSNATLAHKYGKTLLTTGDLGSALSALAIALHAEENEPEILLDYGIAHLELGHHPEEAIRAFQNVLKIKPDEPRSLALLAEATAKSGNHQQALTTYQKALKTNLVNDPTWNSRLSIGMAQAAIALNKPDIAIASLQDVLQTNPDDLNLLKTLCHAYTLAQLHKGALDILLEINNLGANNLEILLWVSDQAITLNEINIAIDALNQAAQLAPERAEILVRLGYIQLEINEPETARKTFGKLFSSDKVSTSDLRSAAQALIGLGDISSSIPYLERALELSNYKSTDLLGELATLYEKAGDFQASLQSIDKHIEIAPNNPDLWVKKADLLTKLNRPKAAIDCIVEALELTPQDARLHHKAAILFHKNNELLCSLEHIERALELSPTNTLICLQAAEINLACLRFKRSSELLDTYSGEEPRNTNWIFLKAEQALNAGDWEKAKTEVETVIDEEKSHPRYLSILARILLHEGQTQTANNTFEQALITLGAFDLDECETYTVTNTSLSIADAALELGHWDVALFLVRQATLEVPLMPRPHLCLAKIYVKMAEHQQNCLAVRALKNAPGMKALSQNAKDSFERSIQNALKHAHMEASKVEIFHWQRRGNYSIHNQTPNENPLELMTPGDWAALIAVLRREGDFNDIPPISEEIADHPAVLFQHALSLEKVNPQKGLECISKAIEQQPNNSFYLALKAYLAKRIGELGKGLESINLALTFQADEPRWHALAAEIRMEQRNAPAAIVHLEQASQLEPDHASHFCQLGKAYLSDNSPGNAIRVLEQAVRLAPSELSNWLTLVKAYRRVRDYDQAAYCAEKLMKLNPNQVNPILLRAKVALEANEKEKAQHFIEQAKQLNPQDPNTLQMLSQLLMGLNHADEAMEIINEAIGLSLEPLPLLLERAKLIHAMKGPKAKIDILIALLKDYPEEPKILVSMVKAYVENKQPEEAVRVAQEAIKLNNNKLDDKQKAELYFQLGTLLRQAGQLDQAIYDLKKAIELAPHFIDAYMEIGEALHQRRQHQQAIEIFKQAIEIAPNNPQPYQEAGILLKDCKDYVGAEAMLRRAATLAPKDLNIRRQLGAVIALNIVHQPQDA